ncbi:ABA4-like family protein [Tenacibaculum sp. SG-28]|uniref:ABA4-like family protein n=1 Tax=Tenacibaculum sp. SG-28 TaxID=754426 RepID=UPI000CF3FB59|nr:ABA4-like family protein [Tenacibaculum sp. SG-28]PQJ23265.1 hypothetical protein BSU00_03355 [Tenacibaculum sp. SG-28]
MTAAQVFSMASVITLPMWILMITAPNWKVTQFLMQKRVVPIGLSVAYSLYVIQELFSSGMMDFGTLSSVMKIFTKESAVLAGWLHYLAFDLLIGIWMLEQNKNIQISSLVMIPCLLGTFMFGPFGFLLFTIFKTIKTKKL